MEQPLDESVTLLPLADVRAMVPAERLHVQLLAPHARALGVGTLRVLRVRETPAGLDVVAGYERYEAWAGEAKR